MLEYSRSFTYVQFDFSGKANVQSKAW
jgi:hypothetical protein